MKISLSTYCKKCDKWYNFFPEVNDENTYEFNCKKGHKCYSKLQHQKFQILLELSIMALLDGYTREAVSSIASALERFYEFYLRLICIKSGILGDQFEQTFKIIKSQSERQLGAFLFCKLLDQKKSFPEIHKNWKEFRNDVVHKGYIPSAKKAIEYGEYIVTYMYTVLDDFKDEAGRKAIISLTNEHLRKNLPDHPDKINMTMVGSFNVIDLNNISNDKFKRSSFTEYLNWLPKQQFYKKFYRMN